MAQERLWADDAAQPGLTISATELGSYASSRFCPRCAWVRLHVKNLPYQSFPASDGYFILGCGNQGLWERMCHAINRPDLLQDSRFSTNTDRVEHRAECIETLSEVFRSKTMAEWVEIISEAGVPCGPINRVSDVVNDPQVKARNMIVDMPHPKVPDLRVPNSPLKLEETPSSIRRAPPMLGEHNEEILTESGYNASQIAQLRESGVIGGLIDE